MQTDDHAYSLRQRLEPAGNVEPIRHRVQMNDINFCQFVRTAWGQKPSAAMPGFARERYRRAANQAVEKNPGAFVRRRSLAQHAALNSFVNERLGEKRGIFIAAAGGISVEMQYPHAADLKSANLNFIR